LLNTQYLVQFRFRLHNRWQQLTNPQVTINDPNEMYRARLLASLFVVSALVVIVFIALSLVIPNYEPDVELQNIIRTGSVIGLLFAYRLSRHGRSELALSWGAIVASTILFLHALTPGGMFGLNVLYYLAAVIFVCGLFASIHVTLIAFGVQPIGVAVLLLLRPDITPTMLVVPMLFNVVMTFFIVIGVYYRQRLDDEKNVRIQHSETRYRALVNSISDIVYTLSPEGVFTSINPAITAATGWLPEEFLGQPFASFDHVDDVPAATQFFTTLLNSQPAPPFEVRVLRKDGQYSWLEIVSAPQIENGQIVAITGSARDITARKQAELARRLTDEQRLKLSLVQERMKLLKQFMDALSHDFRTALSQIETNRYLLERSLSPEVVDNTRPRFDNIAASVRHMVTQLSNLNSISALSDLQFVSHNLNQLLRQLVDAHRITTDAKNLSLTLELAADLPPLLLDDDKIYEILLHLLNNAIAYTPSEGSIRLRTRFDDQQVYVDVIDSGIGIAPEHLSRIFDLFYRVDDARSFNTGGVGLGLSIARLVAEAHSGSLTVASALGQGSTFTLSLPHTLRLPALESE
jgi:PAS domain S-box-containing protein